MLLPVAPPADSTPDPFVSSPKERGMAALESGKVDGIEPTPDAPAQESTGEALAPDAPPAPDADQPVLDVVERVKAALAAKGEAPAAPEPAAPVEVAPAQAGEQTYTREQLQQALTSETALDFLIDQGVDVVRHYNLLTERAGTTVEGRQTDKRIASMESRLDEKLAKIEAAQAQLDQRQSNNGQQQAEQQFHRHLGVNASKYPLLASETPAEQVRRAVRASQDFIAAGEAETDPERELEAICKLAEHSIREQLQRYPSVRLGEGDKSSAVGADKGGSTEPTTLSGSVSSETMPENGETPPHGTPGWRAHMLKVADQLMTG